jgi:hypothetical protein
VNAIILFVDDDTVDVNGAVTILLSVVMAFLPSDDDEDDGGAASDFDDTTHKYDDQPNTITLINGTYHIGDIRAIYG